MNKVYLDGRLTRDVEIRTSKKGNVYLFNIANNDFPLKTDYFNCVSYDEKHVEGLKKGDKVAIIGNVRNNTYTDKNNITHYASNILVTECRKE